MDNFGENVFMTPSSSSYWMANIILKRQSRTFSHLWDWKEI